MVLARKIHSLIVMAVISFIVAASWSFPATALPATQKQTVKETPHHNIQKANKASVGARHLSAARTPIENQKTSPAMNNYAASAAPATYPGWVSCWTIPNGTWNVPAGAGSYSGGYEPYGYYYGSPYYYYYGPGFYGNFYGFRPYRPGPPAWLPVLPYPF